MLLPMYGQSTQASADPTTILQCDREGKADAASRRSDSSFGIRADGFREDPRCLAGFVDFIAM